MPKKEIKKAFQPINSQNQTNPKSNKQDKFYKAIFNCVGFRHTLKDRQIALIRSKHFDQRLIRKLKLSQQEVTQILDNIAALNVVDICLDQVKLDQRIFKNPQLQLRQLKMLILRGNQFTSVESLQRLYMPALTTFQFTNSLVTNISSLRKIYIPNADCIHISTIFQRKVAELCQLQGIQSLSQIYAHQANCVRFRKIDHKNFSPIEIFPKSYPKIQFVNLAKKTSLTAFQKQLKVFMKSQLYARIKAQ